MSAGFSKIVCEFSKRILVLIFATAFIINVSYNVIKSRYQEKAALPTSVPMLPGHRDKRSQQCRFSCI